MTALIVRVLSSLVSATFAVHLIVRSRTWYEGVSSARVHLEAVLLGVFFGLVIASIVSLIKLLLSGFLVSTRSEVLVFDLPQLINEGDEHHPGDIFHSQIQPREDLGRVFTLVDTLEIEVQKEMVG